MPSDTPSLHARHMLRHVSPVLVATMLAGCFHTQARVLVQHEVTRVERIVLARLGAEALTDVKAEGIDLTKLDGSRERVGPGNISVVGDAIVASRRSDRYVFHHAAAASVASIDLTWTVMRQTSVARAERDSNSEGGIVIGIVVATGVVFALGFAVMMGMH